jgi:nicotinate-nucleotide pyrophosphorylase (carboxylating)
MKRGKKEEPIDITEKTDTKIQMQNLLNGQNLPFRQLCWEDIDPGYLQQLIQLAKSEDIQGTGLATPPITPGDLSTQNIPEKSNNQAIIMARQKTIICGLYLIPLILENYGKTSFFTPNITEGQYVEKDQKIGTIHGSTSVLLQAERVVLNFLQRLSGIANNTAHYITLLGSTKIRLLDTRKTTPGWRVLEKYAVACGGGWNHRIGLFECIMLKDNHLAIYAANNNPKPFIKLIQTLRKKNPSVAIEVEVDHLHQIEPILQAKPDILLLDNFSVDKLRQALSIIHGRAYTEASGNITPKILPQLSKLPLDFISCGSLTHQSTWVDISIEWKQ